MGTAHCQPLPAVGFPGRLSAAPAGGPQPTHKKAGRLEITPNPRSWGLSPPAMPGQISENRLGAGKKQQKRIAKLGLHWLGQSRSSPSGFDKKISTLPGSIFLPKTLTARPCSQIEGFLFFRFFF